MQRNLDGITDGQGVVPDWQFRKELLSKLNRGLYLLSWIAFSTVVLAGVVAYVIFAIALPPVR